MHVTDRIKLASELVSKALAAGWMNTTPMGAPMGVQVGAAIDEIVKKIEEIERR